MEIIKTTGMKVQFILVLALTIVVASCGGNADSLEKKKAKLEKKEQQYEDLAVEIHELKAAIDALDTNAKKPSTGRFVSLLTIEQSNFKHYIELQGMAKSDENVSVTTDLGGTVLQVLVDEGDKVHKGQVLLILDDNIIQKQIDELKVSLDLATDVFERQERLWKQNIGSEMQYLQAKNNKESLEKKLAAANAQLAKTRVVSPIDGTVDNISINAGELASPGYPLVRVVDLSKIELRADAAENYLPAIKQGDSVLVEFPAIGVKRSTVIDYVGQVIDPTNRTFGVQVKLDNKKRDLKANLLAVIEVVDYENDSAIVVPTKYIQQIKDKQVVYVKGTNADGQMVAERREVVTGKTYGGNTEVLSGLHLGDQIVGEGSRDVANGEEIRTTK